MASARCRCTVSSNTRFESSSIRARSPKRSSPAAPDRPPVVLNQADFRFRPDGDAWEAADGGAQFGLTFDDFGRRFICYNRVQVQHVVISSRVLRRNPHLAFSETVQDCPAETVAEPLKGHGAAARLYPISRNITTADSHASVANHGTGPDSAQSILNVPQP